MIPANFVQCNHRYGAPEGMEETQVGTIGACKTTIARGSLKGATCIVTAWKPTPEELAVLNAGGLVFLSVIGDGLPPHMLTTSFEAATSPA